MGAYGSPEFPPRVDPRVPDTAWVRPPAGAEPMRWDNPPRGRAAGRQCSSSTCDRVHVSRALLILGVVVLGVPVAAFSLAVLVDSILLLTGHQLPAR